MLMESGIPIAPLERSCAPDTKHMAPATNDMCSHLCRAEPLSQVIEETDDTSSQEDADDKEDNNTDGDSEHDKGGENVKDENDKDENDSNNNNRDNNENDSGDDNENDSRDPAPVYATLIYHIMGIAQ